MSEQRVRQRRPAQELDSRDAPFFSDSRGSRPDIVVRGALGFHCATQLQQYPRSVMRPRDTPFVMNLDPEEEGGEERSEVSLVVVVRVIGRVVLENIRNLTAGGGSGS